MSTSVTHAVAIMKGRDKLKTKNTRRAVGGCVNTLCFLGVSDSVASNVFVSAVQPLFQATDALAPDTTSLASQISANKVLLVGLFSDPWSRTTVAAFPNTLETLFSCQKCTGEPS